MKNQIIQYVEKNGVQPLVPLVEQACRHHVTALFHTLQRGGQVPDLQPLSHLAALHALLAPLPNGQQCQGEDYLYTARAGVPVRAVTLSNYKRRPAAEKAIGTLASVAWQFRRDSEFLSVIHACIHALAVRLNRNE